MKRRLKENVLLATGIFVLSGCAGYDRILFVTKTNIGLDVDNKPPTAEITIARRELAITPTFQDAEKDEKTLPLLASFGLSGGFLDPEITSRFAGGRAALVLAQGPNRLPGLPRTPGLPQTEEDPFLCLSDKPDMRPLWKQLWHFITLRAKEDVKDDTRAFYFATDTSFGLKAGWDGTTGPYPDTLKLGYNRKELAFPPIFATKHCAPNDGKWKVTVPSFIASLDNSSSIKEWSNSGVTHIQFFATGNAASAFVNRPEVNMAMNNSMYNHNKLSIDPVIATTTVSGTQKFQVSSGTGLVKFTIMHDTTGGAKVDDSTGIYTAGTKPGRSIVGAADETGKTAVVTITVK